MRSNSRLLTLLIAGLFLSWPAAAGLFGTQTLTPELIGDHELAAEFAVGPGCGLQLDDDTRDGFKGLLDCYEGELFLTFDEPVELLANSLVITAEIIDPDDPDLMSRLPSASAFIPSDFPVLFRVLDEQTDSFTFGSRWEMEIETRELEFSDGNPLRLFRAAEGCPAPGCLFEDATFSSGFGSYHVRGSFGTFSEFIIAADLRPSLAVVEDKISQLSQDVDELVENGDVLLPIAVLLQTELQVALSALQERDFQAAFSALATFALIVDTNAGDGVGDVWDPDQDLVSAEGILSGGAESAIFSIDTAARPRALTTGGVRERLVTDPSGYGIEVTLSFDEAVDLQEDAFEIDAVEVDPFDSGLLSRLPAGVTIDPDFPVLVQIGADSSARPAARGDWDVLLRTRQLNFAQDSTFRLFATRNSGGAFFDATKNLGVGSLLARGAVAEFDAFNFSEFLIVRDSRGPAAVVSRKFTLLETLLGTLEVTPELGAELEAELQEAKSAAGGGNLAEAIDLLDDFIETVDENAGAGIPDIWRADDERTNDAGRLASKAKSLQFSLSIENSPLEADPADVNRDGKVDAADVFAAIERVYCPNGCNDLQSPAQPRQ